MPLILGMGKSLEQLEKTKAWKSVGNKAPAFFLNILEKIGRAHV